MGRGSWPRCVIGPWISVGGLSQERGSMWILSEAYRSVGQCVSWLNNFIDT